MTLARLVLIGLLFSLPACGFQLRGLANLPQNLSDIQLNGGNLDYSDQVRLTKMLQRAGARVHTDADNSAVRLRVSIKELPERLLVDSVGSGQSIVRLARELSYSVVEADGNPLVENRTLISTQDIELDENNLLVNEAEKQPVIDSMTDNLFNSLLIQLQRL